MDDEKKMNNALAVFTQNILPIMIVASFGFALRRGFSIDKRSLSTITIYCLSPCLVFSSLINTQLGGGEVLDIMSFVLLIQACMATIGFLIGHLLGLSRVGRVGLIIMLTFANVGNFGLTLNQLRFGDAGLSRAVIYYTVNTLMLYTVGLFIASMGQLNWRQAVGRVLRLPPLYAAILAVICYSFSITVPAPLLRGIEVAGNGAIPVMLLVLGMQIADLRGGLDWRMAIPVASLRLLVAPLIGVGIAALIGLEGLSRSTSLVQASMPPAVFVIILATEFDLEPSMVTGVTVLTTLLSPVTLSVMITLLGL